MYSIHFIDQISVHIQTVPYSVKNTTVLDLLNVPDITTQMINIYSADHYVM